MNLRAQWEDRGTFEPFAAALGIDVETILGVISDSSDADATAVIYTVDGDDGPVMWRATVLKHETGALRIYGSPVELPDGMAKLTASLEAQVRAAEDAAILGDS